MKILVIDVGGTHVKVLATGYKKLVEIPSGPKMTAKYTIPIDESIGVVLVITFEGNSAKGTWAAREKASGTDVATGMLTVTKK